jgi:diguanylate cyclase (GGDEF)-like protein/PAS domain S-box-containing protein
VIALLWRLKPQTLDLRRELLQWLVFALTMPWFAMMGGYIAGLREKLKSSLHTVELSEYNLAEAQRLAHFGSWSFDPATGKAAWSAETYRIMGCDPGRTPLVGAAFRALIHEEDREPYARLADQALMEGTGFDTEYRIVLASGATRWVHSIAQSGFGSRGSSRLLRGTVLDITQRKQAEQRIRQLAHFDTLTGLANRSLMMELSDHALHKTLQSGSPLAILFIDLDGFKRINDTLGHAAGDAVLATFSKRLLERMRKTDMVARVGGDEFIVVVDDFSDHGDLATIAEKVLAAAGEESFRFEGHECKVSASIGIAEYPSGGADVGTLMNSADTAMYVAKHAGKNTYRFWAREADLRSPLPTFNWQREELEQATQNGADPEFAARPDR